MTENPLAKYRRQAYDKSAPWDPVPSGKPAPRPGFWAEFPVQTPQGEVIVTLEGPAPKTMEQFEAISELWCRHWGIPPMEDLPEDPAKPYHGKGR